MRKGDWLRLGILALVIGAGLAMWTVYVDEHLSQREHEWRMKTSPFFQEDFHPGEKDKK